jgi:membrane-associated phospholipid phosphatase
MQLNVTPSPWFSDWNFHILQELFRFIPHNLRRDSLADFVTMNALVSTWIYAAVFYLFWRIEDSRTVWRRTRLLEILVAFCLAMLATLAWRPLIGWPAPNLVTRFQKLYPTYFWYQGNWNCFPSHSTLIYLIVAAGLWPFKRWLSALLMLWVLLAISLPRVYVGGHYPVDVLAAILLAVVALWTARHICANPRVSGLLMQGSSMGLRIEWLLFLWLFELGEGFRSSNSIATYLARATRNIWH